MTTDPSTVGRMRFLEVNKTFSSCYCIKISARLSGLIFLKNHFPLAQVNSQIFINIICKEKYAKEFFPS